MVNYNQYPIQDNFTFLKKMKYHRHTFSNAKFNVHVDFLKERVLKIAANYKKAPLHSHSEFRPVQKKDISVCVRRMKRRVEFRFRDLDVVFQLNPFTLRVEKDGKALLASVPGFIGLNGSKVMYSFQKEKNTPFWGFGEKTGDLNKNGQFLKMWNTDVWFSHRYNAHRKDYDPAYASIPFFIIRVQDQWFGFLLDNPCQTFFDLGRQYSSRFYFGSYDGASELFLLCGNTLADIFRGLRSLVGRVDLPPVWALGHHQCRWSYASPGEVRGVVRQFEKERIPLSSLWLDIDYMKGFRIFTWDTKRFSKYRDLVRWLHNKGVRVVTIVDPGIRMDRKYDVYREASSRGLLCRTGAGREYVGFVWPGKTVFPDFSMPETRKWWAGRVARFLKSEIDGIWLDMNDPATGESEREDMLFKKGKVGHRFYHNQYANLMARATKEGILQRYPDRRTFILTRSAYTGIQKYAAVWTGDNHSSWEHLQMSIPESLNLSLSGVPFNGADIGGFGGNTTAKLLVRWYQANFLFPFCRNHSVQGSVYQEAYRFSSRVTRTIRKFLNLRYRLIPYLYQLFHDNSVSGQPVLRPLFYEFPVRKYFDLEEQFMVGPCILQSPVLQENDRFRLVLPEGQWYDILLKKWVYGPVAHRSVRADIAYSPVYIRDGSILPVLPEGDQTRVEPEDMRKVEFDVYLGEKNRFATQYYEDDGRSLEFRKGRYNLYRIEGIRSGKEVKIEIQRLRKAFKGALTEFRFNIITHSSVKKCKIGI